MITGIRIDSVEAKRTGNEGIKGLDANISIDTALGLDVEVTKAAHPQSTFALPNQGRMP